MFGIPLLSFCGTYRVGYGNKAKGNGSMLEILATIAANILSLPGILGLGLGMATRKPLLGSLFGALVGVATTLVFADMMFGKIDMTELVIAVFVGAVAGGLGSLIRIKGATV